MGAVERVQEVASAFKDSIPPEFVRSEAEQLAITMFRGPVPEVPTVDFRALTEEEAVAAVAAASREWGMFQVVNHGIPDEVIRKLQTVGREFFGLPQVEKEVYARPAGAHGVEGYGTKLQKEVEGKKAWVDHLFHKIWPPSAINYQFWPKNPTSYREVNEEYAKLLREVADKVLQMLALGLGLESHEIREAIGGEKLEYMMKINYYPPCPRPDLALGVVAHTDASSLTILVPNEVQGLQAFKDDQWFDVNYIPNALVIHIGDQIEIISNGKYKSVLHRTTVDKENTRMSWPLFLEPPADLPIGPNPKLIDEGNKPKYKTKKFGEYFHCKLNKLPQ